MDWIREILETFLAPAIGGIVTFVIAKVGNWVVAFLKKKIDEIDNVTLRTFLNIAATEVVKYVEQKYADLQGTEKFEKAVELCEQRIDDLTEKMNLGREIVSKQDVEIAIEAAVKTLNGWAKINP